MAVITEMSSGKLENGIMIPMLTSQWRLSSVEGLSKDEVDLLSGQCVSLEYKFNAPHENSFGFEIDVLHDVLLVVEESIKGDIASIATKLMEGKHDISFHNLNADGTVVKTTTLRNCTAMDYTYTLHYGKSESCKFPIKFKCEAVIYS